MPLPDAARALQTTRTDRVRSWHDYGPLITLPHPSPRNRLWLRKHPWFEAEMVPALRRLVATALRSNG